MDTYSEASRGAPLQVRRGREAGVALDAVLDLVGRDEVDVLASARVRDGRAHTCASVCVWCYGVRCDAQLRVASANFKVWRIKGYSV